MELWVIWLVACAAFLVFEIITTGFLFFWLGVAAAITFALSLFDISILMQTAIFVALSTIFLIFIKPLTNKLFPSNIKETSINTMIGRIGIVTLAVNNLEGTGLVKLGSESWSAATNDNGLILNVGDKVKVVKVVGVKVIVEKIED